MPTADPPRRAHGRGEPSRLRSRHLWNRPNHVAQDLSRIGASRNSGPRETMKAPSRPRGWGPEYRITATFRVPLDFAFAWCTDYTPGDAKLEGDSYRRKIIERSSRRVIFEDLEETKAGWD